MSDEREATKKQRAALGLPVVYCLPGSAAHVSGIRGGDVIVEVNGVEITDALSYLRACRLDTDGMQLKIRRGVNLLELAIPLGKRPHTRVNVVERYVC